MPFVQSIETTRAQRIGPSGIDEPALDDALGRAGDALAWLRDRHADGSLPLLRLPQARDDLAAIRTAAERLRQDASDVVLLGTGGLPAPSAPRSRSHSQRPRVNQCRCDGLCRSAGALYPVVCAAVGGKPGQGRQGHHPGRRARPRRSHSQLQLFIGGPRDKLITVITAGASGAGTPMAADLVRLAGEAEITGKTIGDLVAAEGCATAETLARCPVRTIQIARLDEASLGELLMHFMLETIIAAPWLGVDPFDQPAVEEGKVLAKRYLAGRS